MNLLARAQTYSSYKHHNTVKYFITPQGTVSFISDGWGGRVSDKHLTENCGLLNYLIPGDTVASFPGPAQLSIACSTEKRRKAGRGLGTRLETRC